MEGKVDSSLVFKTLFYYATETLARVCGIVGTSLYTEMAVPDLIEASFLVQFLHSGKCGINLSSSRVQSICG